LNPPQSDKTMPTDSPRSVVIVGAGVAGLTIGYRLASRYAVTIVEKDAAPGGLGRSWHYGDFHFDVGPHRFHTENARVAAFIRDILQEEAIEIPRKSGVRMFGRFHDWPLRPSVLLSMPFATMLRASKDLVVREHLEGESFEADVVNKYGRTLHDIFFAPYTAKFLFHSPRELHRDWARAGVNRAIIDKRAQADSLWRLLKTTFLPAPVETMFLYPPTGVGRFSERLADGIRAGNGEILFGHAVTGVETEGDRVTAVRAGARRIPCDSLVWTGPLPLVNRYLGLEGIDLEFLSTIFFNLEIATPLKRDYQWIYFGGDEIFSRVSAPPAFSAATVPPGKSSLCVEVTCREGDARWNEPERCLPAIIADLERTGTLDRPSDVERVHIERVPDTYPIYKLNYLSELTANLRALARYSNLLLAGRCGRFWYNNMDHSIGQGLTMADRVLRGDELSAIDDSADREFWASDSDGKARVREEEVSQPM
jgi:protoporphyrinogen oxidase